jgi:hypothetical protein
MRKGISQSIFCLFEVIIMLQREMNNARIIYFKLQNSEIQSTHLTGSAIKKWISCYDVKMQTIQRLYVHV